MSTKSIGRFAILFIGAIMTVFGLLPAGLSAQELHLQAGTTTSVNSTQASCQDGVLPTPYPGEKVVTGCSGNQLTMFLITGNPIPAHRVDGSAFSRLIVQFQVDTQPGAPDVSVLPVVITLPVTWKGTLADSSPIPPNGPFGSLGSYADVNGHFYVATGQPGNPPNIGTTIAANDFMAATHGGITGCLTVPKGPVSGALMLGKCVLDAYKKEQGTGTIQLSGVIRTGQTYDVVLELDGRIFSALAGGVLGSPDASAVNFNELPFGGIDPSLGLFWTDPMTITIGTDFQSRIAGLQNEIVDLQNQLSQLRQEFKTHTHVYLTGKGVGQNNTKVNTGPPIF